MPSPVLMFVLGVGAFALLALVAALVLGLALGVPWQARRRGHGFASWFVVQLLALNPFYALILVALLPDRAKARARARFAAEIDLKLRLAKLGTAVTAALAVGRSVGDLPTQTADGRSVGDLPTIPPDNRSIGDAATQ